MKIEVYEQRVLTPDTGKYLYNETANIISDKVYLGINANENEWVEINEDQKIEIESKLIEEL